MSVSEFAVLLCAVFSIAQQEAHVEHVLLATLKLQVPQLEERPQVQKMTLDTEAQWTSKLCTWDHPASNWDSSMAWVMQTVPDDQHVVYL